jgi:hypothetical protein
MSAREIEAGRKGLFIMALAGLVALAPAVGGCAADMDDADDEAGLSDEALDDGEEAVASAADELSAAAPSCVQLFEIKRNSGMYYLDNRCRTTQRATLDVIRWLDPACQTIAPGRQVPFFVNPLRRIRKVRKC